jgi:hypothetical protein
MRSARFTAQAATRMRRHPGSSAGAGTSASRSTLSSPGLSKTIAFMRRAAYDNSSLPYPRIVRAAIMRWISPVPS